MDKNNIKNLISTLADVDVDTINESLSDVNKEVPERLNGKFSIEDIKKLWKQTLERK